MHWFTRSWQLGDDPTEDPVSAYKTYLDSVASELPDAVLAFAESRERHLAVDDAKVDQAILDREARRVSLRLLNGDLPTGYGKLRLDFEDADLVTPAPAEAEVLLRDAKTEFLVHEVELRADGRLEVRFLLWPTGELVIRCHRLTTAWTPIKDQTRTAYRRDVVGFGPQPSSDIRAR